MFKSEHRERIVKAQEALMKRVEQGADMLETARAAVAEMAGLETHTVDLVNHPPHYTAGGVECIDAIRSALTPEEWRGYLKGQIIKYTWRERMKGGGQDLEKAEFYLRRLIHGGSHQA